MISYKRRVKLWFCGFQERYEFANRGIASRLSKFRSPAGACLSACDGYFSYIYVCIQVFLDRERVQSYIGRIY